MTFNKELAKEIIETHISPDMKIQPPGEKHTTGQGPCDCSDLDIQPLGEKAVTSIKGMKTVLLNHGYETLIRKNFPDAVTIASIQDFEKRIHRMICIYCRERDIDLLEEIFHCIQLWGGKTGRNIYVRGGGFSNNFHLPSYEKMATTFIDSEQFSELLAAVKSFDRLNKNIGIAFITKHTRFFSFKNKEYPKLPIYDSQLSKNLMNENTAVSEDLREFWVEMIKLSDEYKTGLDVIERMIFNHFRES